MSGKPRGRGGGGGGSPRRRQAVWRKLEMSHSVGGYTRNGKAKKKQKYTSK